MFNPQFLALMTLGTMSVGCGAANKNLRPTLAPLQAVQKAAAGPLVEDHFRGDKSNTIKEEDLRRVLAAPVYIEESARVGVLRVSNAYGPDDGIPLDLSLRALGEALEDTKAFDVVTEVSSDWPCDRGIPGLRELAARYRSEYLLLYRHRFVEHSYTNAWGFGYITLVGALFVPSHTIQTAGVMEATLFDVRSGTILFTAMERVEGSSTENIWQNERKTTALKEELMQKAAKKLGDSVVVKVRQLTATRPQASPQQPQVKPVSVEG